jgi:hypothetical protein
VAFHLLRRALTGDGTGECLLDFLTRGVIALPSVHPLPRRRTAVAVLASQRTESVRLALFTAASAAEPELALEAIRALSGWNDPLVNRFLVSRLAPLAARKDTAAERAVLEHFARIGASGGSSIDPDTTALLRQHVFDSIAAPDWRRAVQATDIQKDLPLEVAVPALIEGLEIWTERGRRGLASRRVQGCIFSELERRTGFKLGPNPQRWRTWWKSSRKGELSPDSAEKVTQVSFFGLRPWTDRVVFVIDRSGSMAEPFGTKRSTRYEEAVRQMLGLLRSMGASTRFQVVLFNSSTKVWSQEMRPATEDNLVRVEQWLDAKHPDGGTALRPAIESAMALRRDGSIRLDELEADTVIVLCDGQTEEGMGWVAPYLERYNAEASLVFHCVAIGSGGDGSLEQLAACTGGEMIIIR